MLSKKSSVMLPFNFPAWKSLEATYLTVAVTSVATLALIARHTFFVTKHSFSSKRIPSPRETLLPFLPPSRVSVLPYPPNIFPGGRDVDSPYGVMKCYEWGPEEGRKVVLVHGDTTPAPMLGPIAEALAERGCRVLILGEWKWRRETETVAGNFFGHVRLTILSSPSPDLWGRGYSDTPLGLPYDDRLFSSQILLALASSPLSWTGASSGGFSIIGFSLGGGITMSFAAHFPYLIHSIILLAPSGLIRSLPSGYESVFFRYPDFVPSAYLKYLVGKILGAKSGILPYSWTKGYQTPLHEAESTVQPKPTLEAKQSINVAAVVQWQFDNHQGFLHSFINTSQHGPVWHQQSDWKKVCDIIKGKIKTAGDRSCNLRNRKILFIFGDSDEIVIEKEIIEDFEQLFGGSEKVEFKVVPGDHGFPVSSSDEVVRHISDFWEAESFSNKDLQVEQK